MARSIEGKWVADFVVSEANGYRSRDRLVRTAGPALQPGDLITATGALATAAADIAHIALAPAPAFDELAPIAVLSRDAEVNDGYILYRTLPRAGVDAQLHTLGIIVRPGVFDTSAIASAAEIVEGEAAAGDPAT